MIKLDLNGLEISLQFGGHRRLLVITNGEGTTTTGHHAAGPGPASRVRPFLPRFMLRLTRMHGPPAESQLAPCTQVGATGKVPEGQATGDPR